MSEKDQEHGFRVVGVFWNYSDFIRVRNKLEKEYPHKQYRRRMELIEVLDATKIPSLISVLMVAVYRCQNCGFLTRVDQFKKPTVTAPTESCTGCGAKRWLLDPEKSEFFKIGKRQSE